eukprot:scaffold181864_cov32-Tisochrysis_lutea.AAC.7
MYLRLWPPPRLVQTSSSAFRTPIVRTARTDARMLAQQRSAFARPMSAMAQHRHRWRLPAPPGLTPPGPAPPGAIDVPACRRRARCEAEGKRSDTRVASR